MNISDLDIGQMWVWKKPDGLYAGQLVRLRIDRMRGDYVYYDQRNDWKFEETPKNSPLRKSKRNKNEDRSLWDMDWSEMQDSELEDMLPLSKESLITNGFQIDDWNDWRSPEPPSVHNRLAEVE